MEEFRVLHAVGSVGSATAGRVPKDVFLVGDTLLVVSTDTAGNDALEIRSASDGALHGTLESWGAGSSSTGFAGTVTSVTATSDRIFVGTTESRVEVFRRWPLAWETTVGTGVWWGNDTLRMVHSFGLGTIDSLLLVRDKSSLRAYPRSGMTLSNRNKVRLHSRSRELATSTAHHGIAVHGTRIFVTDHASRSILVFERKDFGTGAMEVAPSDTIPLSFRPLGIAVHRDELFVTGTDGGFEIRRAANGSLVRESGRIEGHVFSDPGAIATDESRFQVVEQASGRVVAGEIRYSRLTIHP